MAGVGPYLSGPPVVDERANFDLIRHGHQDLVQAVAFNSYGDRCATGSVDGKIRVFNRHKDGIWRHCDNWGAHGGEIVEVLFFAALLKRPVTPRLTDNPAPMAAAHHLP